MKILKIILFTAFVSILIGAMTGTATWGLLFLSGIKIMPIKLVALFIGLFTAIDMFMRVNKRIEEVYKL